MTETSETVSRINLTDKKIAVAGAGITGLTAAYVLQVAGADVTVFERKDHPGGSVRSVNQDGWLAEYGPNTLQLKSRSVYDFIHNLGLGDQVCEADPSSAKRFVLKGGRLVEIPGGILDAIRTPLFSNRAKIRLLGEPFIRRGFDENETLSSFVKRRLGPEFLDYAVDPFVSGIYAGDPSELSVRLAFPKLYNLEQSYGSLIAGAIRKQFNSKQDKFKTRLISFDKGLQQLPEKIAASLHNIHFNSDVSRIQPGSNGLELIANGIRYDHFDYVLANIPLYRVHEQLINGGGELQNCIRIASYPPLSVILTGYKRDQVKHPLDGFGFLVPSAENRNILGSLFNSSLFPGRAPSGHVLLTTFIGGSRQPEIAAKKTEELKKIVVREHQDLIGVSGEPVFFDHIYWPNSIPQYTTEYDRVLEVIQNIEKQNPGVHLIGNFRSGISLPDCIGYGLKIVDHLASREIH
jgi:protoporphyrinogen/coproporphyrinogen III oxidase